jgi:hypothetical protein
MESGLSTLLNNSSISTGGERKLDHKNSVKIHQAAFVGDVPWGRCLQFQFCS